MAIQITNQASVSYTYGNNTENTVSNIATATFLDGIDVKKAALQSVYTSDSTVAYVVTVTNNTEAAITNVVIDDDLGTFTPAGGGSATPLTFGGNAQLYIDGAFVSLLTPVTSTGEIKFTVPSIAAGSTATVIYDTAINKFAPLAVGSTIVNTMNVTEAEGNPVTASETITAASFADVRIAKIMQPETVNEGDTVEYTFVLLNYGNTDATPVILTDAFNPALANIAVTLDGEPVNDTQYTYEGGVLTLPGGVGSTLVIDVPAATFITAADGGVTVNPGETTVVVTGTV